MVNQDLRDRVMRFLEVHGESRPIEIACRLQPVASSVDVQIVLEQLVSDGQAKITQSFHSPGETSRHTYAPK